MDAGRRTSRVDSERFMRNIVVVSFLYIYDIIQVQ
jgi:hypothetical protein